MYSIQCADALADLQHRVGCRLAQVADRYSCMTACLDQVHILMQIAYGSTNADKIVVRLRAKLQCDALACDVPGSTHVRRKCIASAVMLYAVCICTLFGSTLQNAWLTDTDGDGRV